jgi:hypothetical protein
MRPSVSDPSGEPVGQAVLAQLAEVHPEDSPIGSLARTVLSGQMTLRQAASHRWHGEAIAYAAEQAVRTRGSLTDEQRAEIRRAVDRLQAALGEDAGMR